MLQMQQLLDSSSSAPSHVIVRVSYCHQFIHFFKSEPELMALYLMTQNKYWSTKKGKKLLAGQPTYSHVLPNDLNNDNCSRAGKQTKYQISHNGTGNDRQCESSTYMCYNKMRLLRQMSWVMMCWISPDKPPAATPSSYVMFWVLDLLHCP